MDKIRLSLLAVLLLSGCTDRQPAARPDFYVSILPLRNLVERIVGDDFAVEVLVPPGASPETFEPTPRQYAALSRAQLIFNVGLIDFEGTLLSKLDHPERIVNLSRGIDPIAGSCSHAHAESARTEHPRDGYSHDEHSRTEHAHAHGVDPHIWTSPRELRTMAANAYEAIRAQYPDSTKYGDNYARLLDTLDALDRRTATAVAASGRTSFVIYHPALTYYARAYGIRQVAIEEEGKEPTARSLARLIEQARRDGIRTVLYQSQFPVSVVSIVAEDIGAQAVEIDPLAEDPIANIGRITALLTEEKPNEQ